MPNNVNEITSQSGATNRTLTYDLNGSLTSDGGTRTFEWDGANRLVAVNYTGTNQRSEFSYDGLYRCVKIVEKTGSAVNSTRKFVLCGTEKCEYRNNNGAVQLQLFSQGQYQGTGAYFYTRDHLGSIREMTDVNGTVVARYDYDPWGRSTTVIGTTKPDFNFTGLYQHAKSALDLATYRAYDPDLGRWLNRDPIGENGGPNLYGYVRNNPLNAIDPLGLEADIYITRTSRDAPPVVIVYENGRYLGAYVGNSIDGGLANSDYRPGTRGPADGVYELRPRTDYNPNTDNFKNGTPAITGPD